MKKLVTNSKINFLKKKNVKLNSKFESFKFEMILNTGKK